MTQIRVAECIPADQKGNTMNAAEKAEALASIRQDLGGLGAGLVLGAVACYFVRPKKKATNALEMAQRWLAWGLLGSVSSGVSFWVRNYDKGGIVGGLITILFFSGLAWGLGYVWGLIRFPAIPKTANSESHSGPHGGLVIAVVIGLAILGLVTLSATKQTSNSEDREVAEFNKILDEAGVGPVPITDLDTLAEQGSANAQLRIACDYITGEGGKPKDPEKGVFWLRKAADQGLALAQAFMSACYREGIGVTKDEAEAFRWTILAAEQGDAASQGVAGFAYLTGDLPMTTSLSAPVTDVRIESKDDRYAKAAFWFRKAAEQGEAISQAELGRLYLVGKGVAKDYVEAFKWSMLAAKQGNETGQAQVALAYGSGRGVEKDEKQAAKWSRRAAVQGHTISAALMGFNYAIGAGVLRDSRKALAWLYVAAVGSESLDEETRLSIFEEIAKLEKQLGQVETLKVQELAKTITEDESKIAQQTDTAD